MRLFALGLAIVTGTALPAFAAPGDQWILGIHHLNEGQGFTENIGAGYDGTDDPHSSGNPDYFGNSYSHYGFAGDISRVYWELSGTATNSGRSVPSTTELYTVEFYAPSAATQFGYQPIESQFHGIVGEGNHGIPPWQSTPSPAYDEHIPWVGQFSSNHQWLATDQNVSGGQWHSTGTGPQAPESAAFNAGGFGIYMWLTAGSWLYTKWDFGEEIDRSWSAIRLTQITGPPALDGDYNEDGTVDAADYVVWRKTNIGGSEGYSAWVANFGENPQGGGAGNNVGISGVPEPGLLALLGLAGFVGMAMRRRR